MEDELLKEFINESREHLSTIETDLLAIEEAGAGVDRELVNKVFRAAHSIKGGSGFFGLEKVKELAHRAETVLDMMRSGKIIPNAEITNVLLTTFDQLHEMINHTDESDRFDISDMVVNLVGLASSCLPQEEKASLHTNVRFCILTGEEIVLPQTDVDRCRRTGKFIYLIDCDLLHDIEAKGVDILQLFHRLTKAGEILDCSVDTDSVGTLDDPIGTAVPLRLVIGSVAGPEIVGGFFPTIAPERIHLLLHPKDESASAKMTMESAPSGRQEASPRVEPVAENMAPETEAPSPDETRKMAMKEEVATELVPAPVERIPVAEPVSAPMEVKPASPATGAIERAKRGSAPSTTKSATSEETLRVNVGLLENLMNLAGELVLSRNQLHAAVAQDNSALLASVDQRVNQVTVEIQDVIMQTRLQPIGNVFSKFPRVVRDLSQALGKEIELDIEGKDVALDKTLIEGLSDPLTHMVRNAVDHGIEDKAGRVSAGKPAVGKVRIEARHEAGQVVVEIADDGKGLDPDKIAASAVSKGLISAEKAATLSVREKQALVFLPGLSTAKTVSDVSGRGVGMDVVKTNLDRLGGQVEIVSEPGKGSSFLIKMPLTLAIVPSLIVSVGNERFALPQANIQELLRLRPDEISERIESVGNAEVLLLRDRVLPLARFGRFLTEEAGGDDPDGEQEAASGALEIAVVSAGRLTFALAVDDFHDTEEIVVKPLGKRLKLLREYSGATILGDGTVALILDIAGVSAKAELAEVAESAKEMEARQAIEDHHRLQELHALLLFHNGVEEPCALPLELVQRIERIKPDQVERLGQLRTMQYRGGSLPLIALSDVSKAASVDDEQDLVVLVSQVYGREIGLLGSMPIDVIETDAVIDQATHRQKGVSGSSIIRGKTTLVVDLFELVDAVHPEWAATSRRKHSAAVAGSVQADDLISLDQVSEPGEPARIEAGPIVLLAEDSDFFRAQVKKYLVEDGCTVLAAPDGEAAWELLLANLDKIEVVVTDIEMPKLDGLELTKRIRADQRTASLPVVAVTTLAGDRDIEKGKEAGVDEYLIKLDRDKLVPCVRKMKEQGPSRS